MAHPSFPPPVSSAELRPARIWYAAVAGVLLLSVLLAGFFVWRAIQAAPAQPSELRPGAANQVRLEKPGLTIFASRPFVTAECQATGPNGGSVRLVDPAGLENIETRGETWYIALRSAERVPAGAYTVSCQPETLPETRFAAGPRLALFTFVGSIIASVASVGVGVLIALVVFLIVLVKRRNHRSRLITERAARGYGP